jgi:hypothetical protein
VYPNISWKPWKFAQVPEGFWNDAKNLRHFFDDIAKQLNILKHEDWYNVTANQIKQFSTRVLYP